MTDRVEGKLQFADLRRNVTLDPVLMRQLRRILSEGSLIPVGSMDDSRLLDVLEHWVESGRLDPYLFSGLVASQSVPTLTGSAAGSIQEITQVLESNLQPEPLQDNVNSGEDDLSLSSKAALANITIADPKVCLVKKDHQGTAGRIAMKLRVTDENNVEISFDGKITLSCNNVTKVKVFDAEEDGAELTLPLDITGRDATKVLTYWLEAQLASAAQEDVEFKVQLDPVGKHRVASPGEWTDKLTCVELKLDVCLARDLANAAADPVVIATDKKINPGRYIHVQDTEPLPVAVGAPAAIPADKLHHERAQIIVRKAEPNDWEGILTLIPCDERGVKQGMASLEIFTEEMAAQSQTAMLCPHEIEHKSGYIEVKLWVQGKTVSKKLMDCGIKVGIKGLANSSGESQEGDRVCLSVLQVDLEVCESRSVKPTGPTDIPKVLSHDNKHKRGRFVHKQYAEHHGRAGLLVKSVKPDDFRSKLQLGIWDPAANTSSNATFELFEEEIPAAGQIAKSNPYEITIDDVFPADGKLLWAQAKGVSSSLCDAQVRLSIDKHINVCDLAPLTAVELKELAVDIPSTPAIAARAGNSPVARHPFDHAKPPVNASYDHDFATNEAIVLIEDSVNVSDKVKLSVIITPAAASNFVKWHTNRDKRISAPKGDNAAIVSLPGNTLNPVLVTQDAADKLKAELTAGAVGSFHVHPYIDENGNGKFDFDDDSGDRIDREPFLCINLILVRVQGVRNNSIAQAANASVVPAAPTSATGVRISTGGWAPATTAAYSKATVKLTGGGDNGRRGLDQVFSGWGQHIGATSTSASVPKGLDIYAQYQHQPHAAPPALLPAPVMHEQFFIFTQSGAAGTVFGPGNIPVVEPAPVLDVTPLGAGQDGVGGDSCTGQWGGHGSLTAIAKANKIIGQEWIIDTLDSPSVGHGPAHPNYPGTLVNFRFNIDFRVDLLFWTNKSKVAINSAHPAARLYSSVQTNNWTVRFSLSFNPVTGAPTVAVPAVAVTMTKDASPTRKGTPVDGMGLETRYPTALGLFCRDAQA